MTRKQLTIALATFLAGALVIAVSALVLHPDPSCGEKADP